MHQIIVRLCNQLLRPVRKLRQTVVRLCNQLLRPFATYPAMAKNHDFVLHHAIILSETTLAKFACRLEAEGFPSRFGAPTVRTCAPEAE